MRKLEYLEKNSLEQNRELANTYGVGSGMERREDEFPQHYVNPFEKIELLIKKKSFSFPSFIFFMFFGSSYSLEQDNEVERICYTRSLKLDPGNQYSWLERKSYLTSFPANSIKTVSCYFSVVYGHFKQYNDSLSPLVQSYHLKNLKTRNYVLD